MLRLTGALAHIFMVTRRSHTSPAARTLVLSHVFPFTVVYMLTQITHTDSSWHASLHCTFNPETYLSLSLHSAVNFSVLLGVRHVQQLTGDETLSNSMPWFYHQIKLW